MALFMAGLMVATIFGTLSVNAASKSKGSFNTVFHVDQDDNDIENKMTIQEVKKLAYEELSKINDVGLKLQLLSELDETFSTLEDIGVTFDMTVAQAVEVVESKINDMSLKKTKNSIFYPTPQVVYGPIIFALIDADFSDDEGYIVKDGRRLRVDFIPDDVTSDDSYVKIKGMGVTFNFPFNLPDWPVQRFDTFIRIFFGSATSSNGRIVVKGFCIYTIILAEWHRH